MRSDIFGKWLEYINIIFRAQNRKILLLIDNASSHFNPDKDNNQEIEESGNLNLSHIRVHFLVITLFVSVYLYTSYSISFMCFT
jgi:hypothetical protein